MAADSTLWDGLHRLQRHQLRYPSEDVVRFLANAKAGGARTMVDIGCGAGRHMKLAHELGLDPTGIDSSNAAAAHAATYGDAATADATSIPFPDNRFDCAIAIGSLYYGTYSDVVRAVRETHRILRPGGLALFTLRTDRDWRHGRGQPEGYASWLVDLPDSEPEAGMTMTFLRGIDLAHVFSCFVPTVWYELAERTTDNRLRRESEWVVTAQK